MPSNNIVILACAGSGKTTEIVDMAIKGEGRSLLVTYTQNNEREIKDKFYRCNACIPPTCDVTTWFSFLLSHFVRPYQSAYRDSRISEIAWINGKSTQGIPESNSEKFYFSQQGKIYRDKISQFGVNCDARTKGKVIARLAKIYSTIYIDEFQDCVAWDLDIIELLFRSGIRTVIVGDHRQYTYSTNDSPKYKQYRGEGVLKLVTKWKKQGLCEIQLRNENRRSCQPICDLADQIFPHTERMINNGGTPTNHDGVFYISSASVVSYCATYSPKILRWDKSTKCEGHDAMNFGQSKGLGFDRVLVFPNGPIRNFLEKNDFQAIAKAKPKLYVGVTRARYSVAFVCDNVCKVPGITPYQVLS